VRSARERPLGILRHCQHSALVARDKADAGGERRSGLVSGMIKDVIIHKIDPDRAGE
jgi:hypothetical protein